MPELPEVEIVARSLETLVKNRIITGAQLLRERLAPDCSPVEFSGRLQGASIRSVHRRGKHILFDLDNARTLITHLRMSGRFMLLAAESENPKFSHALFDLDDETRLVFQDQRHFGLMKIVDTPGLHQTKELQKLAPEPLSDDFTVPYLRSVLRGSRRSIKEFLLDQTKVCGLGNIYASEALFLARINPAKPANKVPAKKSHDLFEAIRAVLDEAVRLGATLPVNRDDIGGSIYGSLPETGWRVYNREGEPCPHCAAAIVRLKQGGRSSYYCPKCQKR